jgi:hypothetical protein
MILPGFAAEESLRKGNERFALMQPRAEVNDGQAVVPQFIGRGILCGALVAAVLAGQEEFLGLMWVYCGTALA